MAAKKRRVVSGSTTVRELDEIARKHNGSLEDSIDEALGIDDDEAPETPYGQGAVPPDDMVEERRDKPTLHVAEEVPDLGDDKITTLEDLMARYPFDGTGQYFVRVERTHPQQWSGHQCAGVMRPILTNTSMDQFMEEYGGGKYKLRVYGPPRRGGVFDPSTGKYKPKALSPEVLLTIPYDIQGLFGRPPNPDALLPSEEEAYVMNNSEENPDGLIPRPFMRRPASVADAKIIDSQLNHRRVAEDRRAQIEAEERRAEASVERSRIDNDAKLQHRALDVMERELQQARNRPDTVDPVALVKAFSEASRGRDNSADLMERMAEQHRLEMARQSESHKQEMARLLEDQQRQIERMTEQHATANERSTLLHEEQLRVLRKENADERSTRERALEDLRNNHERELDRLRSDHQRAIDAERRNGDQRVADTERNYRMQLDSEKAAHDRELRALGMTSESKQATEKTVLEERIRILNEQLAQERSEKERLKSELSEKSDLAGQMQKFAATAESMGFVKDSGGGEPAEAPATWQQNMFEVLKGLGPQLPAIMQAAGDMVAKNRAPAPQAQPQPAMPQHAIVPVMPSPLVPMQPMSFATEDGPDIPVHRGYRVAPIPVTPSAYPPTVPQPMSQQMPTAPMQPVHMAHPAPMPQPQVQHPNPPEAQAIPMPQTTPAEPAAQANDTASELDQLDQQILMFRGEFESAYQGGITAEMFVGEIHKKMGTEFMKEMSQVVTAERVLSALRKSPESSDSPLLKMRGKQWVHDLETEMKKIAEAAA